ncbi:MAG: flagellar biosynthesis protein FlhB [Firmicutes bacterium HGW-Firmicutes-12]|nr:MAG: flagellar biosynthesis protein FlhB [Firmicutes bacterium HGW-Firmicutes-12]
MASKKAVVLNYEKEQESGAPKIVAVGEGYIAEKIMSLAKENNIPIVEDIELVAKMVKFPIGSEIPPELFEAVAKVLAFIYRIDNEHKR